MARTSATLGEYVINTAPSWSEARCGVAELGDHLSAPCLVPKMHTEGESNGPATCLRSQQSINREEAEQVREDVRAFGSPGSLHPAPNRSVATLKCYFLPTEHFPINVTGS